MSNSGKITDKKAQKRVRLCYLKLKKSQRRLVLMKAEFLTERVGGASHFAEVVQADKSRISRWAKGSVPDEKNSQAITDLEFVYQRLSRFLDDNSADKWLESMNAHLRGRRPIDVLHEGRIVDVLVAANQEEAGSYA